MLPSLPPLVKPMSPRLARGIISFCVGLANGQHEREMGTSAVPEGWV